MSLKRDTFYNLIGSIIPMLISMATVPVYLRLIGDARYGVLALVWLFLGYFGVFDPGISRAASFHIARLHADEHARERESTFWTALLINLAFGLAGGIIAYCVARPLFMSSFKMPEALRGEVFSALPWIAASVPISIVAGVLSGALMARGRFDLSNSISAGNIMLSQLVPLAIAYWHGPDLRWLIPAVLVARMVGTLPTCLYLIKVLPLGRGGRFDASRVKSLFSYGGWITLTNLLNPLLTALDRVLIGSLVSAQAVAYYTVPFNLVSRTSVIPGALAASLFPRFSQGNEEEGGRLASDAVAALAAVLTPVVVFGAAALPLFMRAWVGQKFAAQAASVGIVLFIGIWINGLAYIPYEHLQATERPDIVAKFHSIELLPFLGVLWAGVHFYGLIGAAWAWTLRVTVDAGLLFAVAGRLPNWTRVLPGAIFVLLAAYFAPRTLLSTKTGIELLLLAGAMVWSWRLSPGVRNAIRIRLPSKMAGETA